MPHKQGKMWQHAATFQHFTPQRTCKSSIYDADQTKHLAHNCTLKKGTIIDCCCPRFDETSLDEELQMEDAAIPNKTV